MRSGIAPSRFSMKRRFHVLWLVLVGCLRAVGAEPGGLDIDPLRTELVCAPGAVQRGAISLANRSGRPIRLDVSFEDLSRHKTSCAGWLSIETGTREVAAGDATAVKYAVSIPANAAGEFYGRVGFSVAGDAGPQAGVAINTRISVPLSVVVCGTEIYRAEIRHVRVQSFDPLCVEVAVMNQGNVHLRPVGECEVCAAGSGKSVARFPLNEQGFPVYPGSETRLVARAPGRLEPGDYRLTIRLPFPDREHSITGTIAFVVPAAGR